MMERGWFGDRLWGRWYARCRRLDVQLLWPQCVQQADDINMARAAFAIHAFRDPAWASLGHNQLIRAVAALQRPRQAGVDGAANTTKPVRDESDEE